MATSLSIPCITASMLLVSIHLLVLIISPNPALVDMAHFDQIARRLERRPPTRLYGFLRKGILASPPKKSRHDSELLEVANITSVYLDVIEDLNTSIFDALPSASKTDNLSQLSD